MKYVFIRHGLTLGNLEGRYIGGRADEPLCDLGIEKLHAVKYPPVGLVFASPMKRCLQTAQILYPDVPIRILNDLRECDFGDFENLSHKELNGRADYQAWIDSGGERPFPNGESRADFAKRCVQAFKQAIERLPNSDCAFVVHGGTIMAIMEAYARPKGAYFDFQVPNGDGFVLNENWLYQRL